MGPQPRLSGSGRRIQSPDWFSEPQWLPEARRVVDDAVSAPGLHQDSGAAAARDVPRILGPRWIPGNRLRASRQPLAVSRQHRNPYRHELDARGRARAVRDLPWDLRAARHLRPRRGPTGGDEQPGRSVCRVDARDHRRILRRRSRFPQSDGPAARRRQPEHRDCLSAKRHRPAFGIVCDQPRADARVVLVHTSNLHSGVDPVQRPRRSLVDEFPVRLAPGRQYRFVRRLHGHSRSVRPVRSPGAHRSVADREVLCTCSSCFTSDHRAPGARLFVREIPTLDVVF